MKSKFKKIIEIVKTSDQILFSYSGEISRDEALRLQEERGFPYPGYGFFEYKYENFKTTWKCWRNA